MQRVAFDELQWVDAPMPDGSAPIRLARLPRLADGNLRFFGRFPAAWHRTVEGHYPAFEEIVLLEGDLTVAGVTLEAGDYTWVPAREMRPRTASRSGCLAFGRFGGVPQWTRGRPDLPPDEPRVNRTAVTDSAVLLRERGKARSLVVMQPADLPPHHGFVEWLSLRDRAWICTAPGEPAPDCSGPVFVRPL